MMSLRWPSSRRVGSASLGDDPLAGADLFGKAEVFEMAQPADLLRQIVVGLPVRETARRR
ncbi:MAG: hypothetical protein QM744_06260 [Mesorhizobium sp.]